jgi:glycine oxidase
MAESRIQDVLIVGAGVIGLTLARELRTRGVSRITIVDRGPVGREASWAAAGMLAPNIEIDSNPKFHRFGIESLALYPAFADGLLDETGINIELDRTGTLCLAFNDVQATELRSKYERQKLIAVRSSFIPSETIRDLEPSVSHGASAALLYPDDWQVENRKLVAALRRYCDVNGVRIVENAEVSEILTEGVRVTGAKTSSGDIHAGVTILATGAWTSLIKIGSAFLPVDVKPIRGQMISFQTDAPMLRHVVYSANGYVVPRRDGRLVVGATVEDVGFEKTVTGEAMRSLTQAALEILPTLSVSQLKDHWSGLRPFASDSLPVIGQLPGYDDLLVTTAHYRNGILLAPKTAEILADRIVDNVVSEYFQVFATDRTLTTRATSSR